MKMPNFGTKNTLLAYFWVRISKRYCHIWNKHPQVCLIGKFCKKKKKFKFGIKNALFQYFCARIFKKILSYLKSASSNLSICKNFAKQQLCLNLGPKMPYLCIFGLVFKKILAYLKSANSNFSDMSL